MIPARIVSGGQTGVDRAALDVAMALGIATGGRVPRGRRAEDGRIPERYAGLVETATDVYAERTEANVREADATLVLAYGEPAGGTALTVDCARRHGRPVTVVDLARPNGAPAAAIRAWLARVRPRTLNVAGPRESESPGVGRLAAAALHDALAAGGDDGARGGACGR